MFSDKLINLMQNPPREGRTRLASVIDFFISLLLIGFLTITGIHLLNLGPVLSVAMVLILLSAETFVMIKIKMQKIKRLQHHKNIWYSAKQCQKNLKGMSTEKEFTIFVKELLEAVAPFEYLHLNNEHAGSSVNLKGYLNNKKIGIMCLNPKEDGHKINSKDIKSFLRELINFGLNKGIILTTGYYTEEARRFVRQMNGKIKIHLLDRYAVLRIAKMTDHPVFPNETWQDEELENNLTGMEMAISIKENILASRRKAFWFAALGITLLTIATVNSGLVSLIYLIFGIINLFIGFTGVILSYLRQEERLFDI